MLVERRPVLGFPGYEVGDDGSVWSRRPRNGKGRMPEGWKKLVANRYDRSGHVKVTLRRDGKSFNVTIHSIVLEAFVGIRPAGMCGCHNDGNPANNRVNNLRWDTHASNMADRERHGTMLYGETNGNSTLTRSVVKQIMKLRSEGLGKTAICLRLGLPKERASAVNAVIRGSTWSHVTGIPKRKNPTLERRRTRNNLEPISQTENASGASS